MNPINAGKQVVNKVKGFFGGGKRGASGAGIGPSPMMQPGFKSVNATGATGNPMSQFGNSMAPEMEAGPVANSAPPMYGPPQADMGGNNQINPAQVMEMKRRMGGNTGISGGMGGSMMSGMY
jgi:hypothetical protein